MITLFKELRWAWQTLRRLRRMAATTDYQHDEDDNDQLTLF